MTLMERHAAIARHFYERYLPMEKVFERCGSEFLFKDEEDNLISVVVRYVRKENEEEHIKDVHDKRIFLEEKRKEKERRKERKMLV